MALIAHWPLDGRLDDVIGSNHFIKKSSVLEYENGGKLGSNIKILTANKEQIESTKPIRIPDDFSISFFVNVKPEFVDSDGNNSAVFLSTHDHNDCTGVCIGILNYNNGFNIRIGGGYGDSRLSSSCVSITKLLYNQNYHLTFTYKKSNSEFRIYIDGVLDISKKYQKQLVHKPNFSTLTNKWSKSYDSYYQTYNMYDVRVYNNVIDTDEIKEIMKCKILHFKFNKIEIPQYNSAESQTNIIARAGITISNKKQIKSWNFATISGTTTVGNTRKGVIRIPVTSYVPSENKYSVGIDFRIIGDDISNYDLTLISNHMTGNPSYTPTRVVNNRYMYENVAIVDTFDLCLYSKVDDYRIPDNVQILWRHIQLEPYPNCTPYVESTAGSNYFHDSSDFRNKGTLGGMRFTPPIYNEENKSLTLYNDGSYSSTINNIMTDINLGPDILNQPDFEITIMCRIRTKNVTGYGLIMGSGAYGGIGIAIHESKLKGYIRTTDVTHYEYIGGELSLNVNSNEFIDIALTYSRETNKATLFALDKTSTVPVIGAFQFSDSRVLFGILSCVESGGNGPWLSGNIEISDVQVYRTALTKEEIDEAFSKKIELTPKGTLKSKYTSNKSSNLVDLNPPEYEYGEILGASNHSLIATSKNNILIRGTTIDSFTPRYILNKPIKPGDQVTIELYTVKSDSCTGNIGMEFFLFKHTATDPGLKLFTFYHPESDGLIKNHKFNFIADGELNCFRVDVNNSTATILYKDINISIVRNSVEISDKIKLDQLSYRKSLPQTNLIDYTTWKLNTRGFIGEFNLNGTSEENKRMIKLNPWNKFDVVWATETNDIESNDDGGFNHFCNVPIDPKNTYRYSVWIRRENKGNGNIYLGPSNNGGYKDAVDWVASDNTSGSDMNPYWISSNPDVIKNDEWYLMVGYLYGKDIMYENMNLAQGIFDITGKQLVIAANRYRHNPANTLAKIRSYLYYSTVVKERCYWYRPRIDLCDGTEPTIDDLLKGREHGSIVEALGKFNPTFPPDEQFLEIKRAHGARWGKIFYHNNKAGTVLFSDDINEFLSCNTEDKKSILRYLPYMRGVDDKFEFLLEYDSFEGYNRWKQTSIFTRENISGYEAISISWSLSYWGGLAPAHSSDAAVTYVDGSPSKGTWWYSIGCKTNYAGGIPGPGDPNKETEGVHLWVRLPEVAFITPDNTLVVNDIECP
ncbi:MAG: LamG-like jellyroll fold domain-containing protein [Sarcina sp.]